MRDRHGPRSMGSMVERAQIIVNGVVQGVGFRPYVYNLAIGLHLTGYVTNSNEGVFIDVEGTRVSDFIKRLAAEAPPLSQITNVSITPLPIEGYPDFTIRASLDQANGLPFTLVSPDEDQQRERIRRRLERGEGSFHVSLLAPGA